MADFEQFADEDLWERLSEVSGRERIEVLAELSDRAMRAGQFTRAQTLLQEADRTAAEVGDRRWAAEILYAQGVASFNAGDIDAAIDCYGRATERFVEIGMNREAARAVLCQADGYLEGDDREGCLAAAREAQGLVASDMDVTLAGEACHLQAQVLHLLGRHEEALEACDAGRSCFQQAGRPDQVLRINDLAITVNLDLGRCAEAQQVAGDCLAVARLTGKGTAWARYRMAEVLQRRGKYKKALKEVTVAQQEYRTGHDLVGVSRSERLRADALMGLGRQREALGAFEQAQAGFETAGRGREALRCEIGQAVVWQSLGRHTEAERINRRLLETFAEFDPDGIDAQWTAVRLLDNLIAQSRYPDCCAAADVLMRVWPQGSTAAIPSYREFLGQWSWALAQSGRPEYAVAMAAHVLNHTPGGFHSPAVATSHEIRARYRLDRDLPGAVQELALAIGAHLAMGQVERARDLASGLAGSTADAIQAAPPALSDSTAA